MIEIPLRNRVGDLVGVAWVDNDDAVQAAHRWCLNDNGYAVRSRDGRIVRLHRELLGCVRGDGVVVDHRNGHRLDCRRQNLRAGTNALNGQNRSNSSGVRGAHWSAAAGRWRARVKIMYVEHHLGLFDTRQEAADAAAAFRAAHMPYSEEASR